MSIYKTKISYRESCFYLWQSNDDADCFLVENEHIACFLREEDLRQFMEEKNLSVEDEGTVIEIPAKQKLCKLQKDRVELFCSEMLNLWNLAMDIRNSYGPKDSLLDGHKRLHDKLFYGNNLESLTPAGCKYVPEFTVLERRQLQAVMDEMYRWFDEELERYII